MSDSIEDLWCREASGLTFKDDRLALCSSLALRLLQQQRLTLLHIAHCILHIFHIAYIAYCILLHIEYLMVRPWWSMERRGRQGWLNKTLQFPLRSRPRTCSPPRPRSPRALSQVSFRSYRTLSSLAVTPRLFLSIGSLAEASLRRCTTAEIQVLCERRAKVNLAFEQFDSVTNTYRLSEMSAAMGGPDFLPPSRM